MDGFVIEKNSSARSVSHRMGIDLSPTFFLQSFAGNHLVIVDTCCVPFVRRRSKKEPASH
jgi:hypothetical protein